MDVEDFSAIVADIYDAALDPPLWRKVLKDVCGFTRGGPSASLFWQDAARKTGNSYFVWGGEARFGHSSIGKNIALNPFTPAARSFPVEQLYSAADVLPPPEFIETEFYKEWMSPQGWGDVCPSTSTRPRPGGRCSRLRVMHATGWLMRRCASACAFWCPMCAAPS